MSKQTLLTSEEFAELLPALCNAETSMDPAGWTPRNPLWGHCAVVALVAQNVFGGKLLRALLAGTPFAAMGSHYWNELPNGIRVDFTMSQFGRNYPDIAPKAEVRTRASVLFDPNTGMPREIMGRYALLCWRLARVLYFGNRLFDDTLYRECLFAALGSQCQKMWFGCVITHAGNIVTRQCNTPLEPLKHLCEPTCIRFSIQSRTESMLGACSHAEEFALWDAARQGVSLEECDLYIAGVHPNGMPWFKTEGEHTCIRCSVQMYQARIGSILVPVNDHWERISRDAALRGAVAYMTGERKI